MTIVFIKTNTNKNNPSKASGKPEKHSTVKSHRGVSSPAAPNHSLVGRLSGNVGHMQKE